ncbi:MAG: hypothetical protein A4E28_00743 [Methanocella sp. PtaU1.Bin125]|nr:MAG: hypothetical protein A4E28_00743 [Methanocella sp. PtaU1.Bin125]
MGEYQPSDYQTALDLFNQTIANLTRLVEESRADAINEINAYQAATGDMDTGAYDLTMYGIDSVTSVQRNVIENVGNASNYFINNSTTVMTVETELQTEHTGVSSSMISHFFSDPTSILPTHDTGTMMVWIVFGIILVMFLLHKR